MSIAKWCCHPTRHQGSRRMGPEGPDKHRKGKCRVSYELAVFINATYSTSDAMHTVDGAKDQLCTTCLNFEMGRMAAANSSNEMDTVDNHSPTMRSAAILASTRISDQFKHDQLDTDLPKIHYSSDAIDSETLWIETSEQRARSISVLNEIFALVGEQPVRDVRNRNILRIQANNALTTIRRLAENILENNGEQTIQEHSIPEYTLNEGDELIRSFRHLVYVSDYDEQIRLLTLSPSNWGRTKVESFFNCTERQARYAVYLRDSGHILHRPIDLRGNLPFDLQTEKAILDFYHDDLISRVSPNKKDVLKKNTDPKPIRYMLMTLFEAYQQFIKNKPHMRVGKSKFSSLKPKWVKTATPHDGCACVYHQNPALLLNAWNRMNHSKIELSELITRVICYVPCSTCYARECENCGNRLPAGILLSEFGGDEDDDITWMIWKRTEKKIELQRISGSISSMLDELDSLWSHFLLHHFYTIQQRSYIKLIKDQSSDDNIAVVQLDFAENFSLISQTEIQSAHWGHLQATIFTVHVKMGSGHRNLSIISDYMHHTTEFVYYVQGIITSFMKINYPNVKHLNYVSDGAGAHFKNNKNILNLTFHKIDFGLSASWTFSATSHGKGPVDGIGAAIKSRATRHLLSLQTERAFLSAWEFFDFTNRVTDHQKMNGDLEPNRPIDVFYVASSTIDQILRQTLLDRWSHLPTQWVKGIQKMHQFDSNEVQNIDCRETSFATNLKKFKLHGHSDIC